MMRLKAKFTIYQEGALAALPGTTRGWRWRLTAANGNIIADGAEAYAEMSKAKRAVKNLLRTMGVNVSGRGWRANIVAKYGLMVEVKK